MVRGDGEFIDKIFDLVVLEAAGVTRIGDKVKIQFNYSSPEKGVVKVEMLVWMSTKASSDFNPRKYIEENLDLDRVGEALG